MKHTQNPPSQVTPRRELAQLASANRQPLLDRRSAIHASNQLRSVTWRSRLLAMTVGVGLLTFTVPASATPFDTTSTDWEGCSRLLELAREELGTGRIEVVDELDYSRLGPVDGILMIHPQGSYDVDELATFMKLGGRLALVDDFGDGDRLLDRFRITRGPAPSDPLQMLRGNPQLPIATPSSGHPIVADVAQVLLNHPTMVRHPDLSSLLRVPRTGGDAGPDVALAGQVGEGRLVAIGDPSILINSMLRYPGNRAFTRNLLVYLLDGAGERKRDAKLFIVRDKFKERGTLGNSASSGFRERMRSLTGALDTIRRGGFGAVASRIVALGIAIAAAVWVAFRAAKRAQIPRPRYAASDSTETTLQGGVDDIRLGNLFEISKRRFRSRKITPTGEAAATIADALDLLVEGRADLRQGPRDQAIEKLAQEAKEPPREASQLRGLYLRLRRLGPIPRTIRLSDRDFALLTRVMNAHRDRPFDPPSAPFEAEVTTEPSLP